MAVLWVSQYSDSCWLLNVGNRRGKDFGLSLLLVVFICVEWDVGKEKAYQNFIILAWRWRCEQVLIGGIKLTGIGKIWKHKYFIFFWRNSRNEASVILGSSPWTLFVFKKDSLYLSCFFSLHLPALLLTLFGKHPLREQKSPVKIIDPASHCEETEIQGIYSWIERRCILEWNTCCLSTPHLCLLRSDFVKGEDKVSLIWVEVMWLIWYLCHWKVKVCLGIK